MVVHILCKIAHLHITEGLLKLSNFLLPLLDLPLALVLEGSVQLIESHVLDSPIYQLGMLNYIVTIIIKGLSG